MDNYLDVTKEQFMEFSQMPIDTPLQMLNLLKFKEQVIENNCTGEEQYKSYMKAAFPFFKKAKAKILFYGAPKFTLIGPESEWDKVLVVEYASKADFMDMITSKDYPTHLRKLALQDSRLIYCQAIDF